MRIPRWMVVAGIAIPGLFGLLFSQLPALGARGLLHPLHLHLSRSAPKNCEDVVFAGAGIALRGWRCRALGSKRGTIVYLHGITDNRSSGIGVVERFSARGFDVVAYDSRAHGESEGDACTYGYFEKQDLSRVVDTLDPRGIVLFGTSLGAAVALQEAAEDRRIAAVVAAETFSDLRTIARERAPFFFTAATIRKAFALAEERGKFK